MEKLEELAFILEDIILSSDIYAGILDGKISVEHVETVERFDGGEKITVPFNADFWCDNYNMEESQGLILGETPIPDKMIIKGLNDYVKRKRLKAIVEVGGSERSEER